MFVTLIKTFHVNMLDCTELHIATCYIVEFQKILLTSAETFRMHSQNAISIINHVHDQITKAGCRNAL